MCLFFVQRILLEHSKHWLVGCLYYKYRMTHFFGISYGDALYYSWNLIWFCCNWNFFLNNLATKGSEGDLNGQKCFFWYWETCASTTMIAHAAQEVAPPYFFAFWGLSENSWISHRRYPFYISLTSPKGFFRYFTSLDIANKRIWP